MKMPRIIPEDKANHRVRGSEVAAVCASIAVAAMSYVINTPPPVSLAVASAVAIVSAGLAGKLVEAWQAKQNAKAVAAGKPAPHTIEQLDVIATLRGGVPVSIPLGVLAVVLAL